MNETKIIDVPCSFILIRLILLYFLADPLNSFRENVLRDRLPFGKYFDSDIVVNFNVNFHP